MAWVALPHGRIAAAVAAVLTMLPVASGANAAGGPPSHAAAPRSVAVDKLSVLVPVGLTVKADTVAAPADGQWLAQAILSASGTEIVRVEVYANPRALSVGAWAAAAWQDLARQTLLRPGEAGVPRWKALRGDIAASPQSHARSVALAAAGQRLVHIACTLANTAARHACDAVVAGLDKAGAP